MMIASTANPPRIVVNGNPGILTGKIRCSNLTGKTEASNLTGKIFCASQCLRKLR
jgi:hypothetical protein